MLARAAAICGMVAANIMASPVLLRADYIYLRQLEPQRLGEIERGIAPAQLFTDQTGRRLLRARIVEARSALMWSESTITARAWWRRSDRDPLTWSGAPITLKATEILTFVPDYNSLFDLRLLLSDRDLSSGPIGSAQWVERMRRALDPEGRFGLARANPNPETNEERAAVRVPGTLFHAIVPPKTASPAELQALNKELSDPFHPARLNFGAAGTVQRLVAAVVRDEAIFREGESFRHRILKAISFLAGLARITTRQEFRFGTVDPGNPGRTEVPQTEQVAQLISGYGWNVRAALVSMIAGAAPASAAVDDRRDAERVNAFRAALAAVDDVQFRGLYDGFFGPPAPMRAGTPLEADLPVEPADTAYWALDLFETEPALWVSPVDDALQIFGAILSVAAPLRDSRGRPIPGLRLADRRHFGRAIINAGFVQKEGVWSELQVKARNALIRLMQPDLNHPEVIENRMRNEVRDAAAGYQTQFCDKLVGSDARRAGELWALERTLIEMAKRGTPPQLSGACLRRLWSVYTNVSNDRKDLGGPAYSADFFRNRLGIFLVLGALPTTAASLEGGLNVVVESIVQGQSSNMERNLLNHVTAGGGYVWSDKASIDVGAARAAWGKVFASTRKILAASAGDAAQIEIRSMVNRVVKQVDGL